MSKEQIKISYDGEALKDGSMDIKELAPALLSLGALCERANEILNGDQATITVNVKSDFLQGSFGVLIELWQSIPTQIKTFITGQGITKTKEILEVIGLVGGGSIGLIKLLKWLKGKNPENIVKLDNGATRIGDIIVNVKVLNLYEDSTIRQNLENVLNPLKKEGVNKFEIKHNDQVMESVLKDEVDYFSTSEIKKKPIHESTIETFCEIVKPSFSEDLKWNLISPEGGRINAEIKDEQFLSKIKSGEMRFGNGDILQVSLNTKMYLINKKFKSEHEILKVLKHIQGSKIEYLTTEEQDDEN